MSTTPVGESAVTAKQTAPPAAMSEGVATTKAGDPVAGATPVGESTRTAPPAPPAADTPAKAAALRLQSARNLALLARSAISNGYETMGVKPGMVADLCVAVEEAIGGTNEPTLAPTPAPVAHDPTAEPAANDAETVYVFKGAAQSSAAMVGGPVSIWHNDETGATDLVGGGQPDPLAAAGWRRLYTALPTEAAEAPAAPFAGPGQGS